MKNEKFCFSKGTGLIALVGILLVGFVLFTQAANQPKSTNSKAAPPRARAIPSPTQKPIEGIFAFEALDCFKRNMCALNMINSDPTSLSSFSSNGGDNNNLAIKSALINGKQARFKCLVPKQILRNDGNPLDAANKTKCAGAGFFNGVYRRNINYSCTILKPNAGPIQTIGEDSLCGVMDPTDDNLGDIQSNGVDAQKKNCYNATTFSPTAADLYSTKKLAKYKSYVDSFNSVYPGQVSTDVKLGVCDVAANVSKQPLLRSIGISGKKCNSGYSACTQIKNACDGAKFYTSIGDFNDNTDDKSVCNSNPYPNSFTMIDGKIFCNVDCDASATGIKDFGNGVLLIKRAIGQDSNETPFGIFFDVGADTKFMQLKGVEISTIPIPEQE